ncbi:MAG: hypothetical protein RLZZ533_901 [Cyanobacteriota bacterium]
MDHRAALSRRRLLQLTARGGALLGAAALGGCRGLGGAAPQLLLVRGQLPAAWSQALPDPWRARPLESPQALLQAAATPQPTTTLLALGDGWAQRLPTARLRPLAVEGLLQELAPMALPPSRLFAPSGAPTLAFPWAFGTWVLLLRNRPDLLRRRGEGWSLLLDPSLRGRLVLPSSPRVVIELALRELGVDPADPAALADPRLPGRLAALRRQSLAFDERDGVQLLLAGDAEAAVVPSQRAVPLLLRDPRLEALLPESGSPLSWQVLMQLGTDGDSGAPLPLEWLRDGLTLPLLDRLLAAGWVPPLPPRRLEPALARWPRRLRTLLLPPVAVLARCTNLPAFDAAEQRRWQTLWDGAMGPG